MSMYVMPELARLLVKERLEEAARAGQAKRYAECKPSNGRRFFGFSLFGLGSKRQPAACSC